MRKLTIIIFSLFLMATESHAVSDSLLLDNMSMDLQIRQKPGKEKRLTEYLRNLPTDCDTIYAIIYWPNQCPRCETCIQDDYAALKRVRPDAQMALITVFPDSARASVYNHDNKYDADLYLYDTDGEYLNIFSFNSEEMIGTYILKMCRSTGRLLFGAETFYIGDDEFMRELTAWSGPMPMNDFSAKDENGNVIVAKPVMPECAVIDGRYCDYAVDTCGVLLSQLSSDAPKYDGDYLYFNDELDNHVMLFRNDGNSLRLISKVEPDSTEKDRFIEVDEPLKSRLGTVYYIPLDPVMPDSNRLCVSYSLPNIFPDTIGNTGGLAYFNKAVVISQDVSSGDHLPMYVPDFDMADTTFFYKHFKFCMFKGEVVFACQKLT